MNFTQYAQARFQQRGFDGVCLDYLGLYGTCEYAPRGAFRISIPKKKTKQIVEDIRQASNRIIQLIEKSSKRAAIVDGNEDMTITLYVRR